MYRRRTYLGLFLAVLAWQTTLAAPPGDSVEKRILLIGDGGQGGDQVFRAAAAFIDPGDSNTTVVLLGNNIYPRGLPPEEDNDYAAAAAVLQQQLLPFKDHRAPVYVVPGNRDWDNGGPDGLQQVARQSAYVDSSYRRNAVFLPKDGCPGPEEVPIGDNIVLVVMDSQWWLHGFTKTDENSDCDCKTDGEVLVRLQDIAYRNRDRHIILAMHHPLKSHGIHGGYFTWKQHLFPLTDAASFAYVPLPLVGSLYPLVRSGFGAHQDLRHPAYRNMIAGVRQAMATAPGVTYVGAHDHNLQLLRDAQDQYIVSGSGSTTDRVAKRKNTLFAAAQPGFIELMQTRDGKLHIVFYALENGQLTPAYRHTVAAITRRQAAMADTTSADFSLRTHVAAPAPEYDSVGGFHRALFGKNYRKVWAAPVNMDVFYIGKEKGGLTVTQRGGGMQTKSLRLKDPTGKEWVLRTVQKEPSASLAPNLRKTIVKDILQDEISTAQPYAPLTIPPMADAIGVPHANPRMVWVPDDPALEHYRPDFANTVCIFEEREPGVADNEKTYSTPKVLAKLQEDQDNSIDQEAVVRARLFDLVIGDWDRHEDQWRWGKREDGKRNIYFPIPRDRDQVYYINSGVFPAIIARRWLIPKFQGFKDHVPYVEGFMFNGRYFDRFFLQQLEEQQWKDAAAFLQKQLTDSLIDASVRLMPDTIYALTGPEIARKLKARRDILDKEALKYYRFLAKAVDIPGSDKQDHFVVEHKEGGVLEVTATKIKKDGSLEELPFYHRSFKPDETKEIRLYGRGGEDVFSIDGSEKSCIKVRMIGGSGADSFAVAEDLHNRRRTIIYDRKDEPNSYPERGLYRSLVSRHKEVNDYDGRTFRYNKLMPAGAIRFNPDDGVLLGVGLHYTTHGFRKEPFSTDQQLIIGHSLTTQASFLRYNGTFKRAVGPYDLNLVLDAFAPDNVRNFFGIGNESTYDRDRSITYYRTRYNIINAQVRLRRPLNQQLEVFAGLAGQYYKMNPEDNEGRFIRQYESVLSEHEIYKSKFFAGLSAGFELDTRNNLVNTTRGIYWQTAVYGVQELGEEHGTSTGQITTSATIYASLRQNPNFVLVNRLGAATSIGHPLFFQLQYLGGVQNLRGYRNNRFAGHQMVYHNLEARIKLFDFASYLFPASIGLIAFNDVGRVWARGESSGKWHDGYGGGVYLIPAELVYVGATVGLSEEGAWPYVVFSFNL